MAYIADADYLISAMAGRADAIAVIARLQPAGISIGRLTSGELYDGAFGFPDPQKHLAALRAFLKPYPVVDPDDLVMERFAEIRAQLRRRGQMIPSFDIVLAAIALQHNLTILTQDAHYNRIPGLRIYQPT